MEISALRICQFSPQRTEQKHPGAQNELQYLCIVKSSLTTIPCPICLFRQPEQFVHLKPCWVWMNRAEPAYAAALPAVFLLNLITAMIQYIISELQIF